MTIAARLVTTITAPLDPASADAPELLCRPGRTLLVQRGDAEVVAFDVDGPDARRGSEVRFPAPWPRRFGTVAVSPARDAAVFAGVHAVRSVGASGATRWEVRHGCWGGCPVQHASSDEYADDGGHVYPDSGSVAVSADGGLVWAHVRGPLAGDGNAEEDDEELWVVLDAESGRVMGRVSTGTVASQSLHTPHPDPSQMGLSLGEGEEGSPVLWGRWDGRQLTAEQVGVERILLAVSPSGRRLLTVPVGQWSLLLHDLGHGSTVVGRLDAADSVPAHPRNSGTDRVFWDVEAAFVDEDTVVAGTSECDAPYGPVRHWLVDVDGMRLLGELSYPFPVVGPARTAGSGRWYTLSKDGAPVHLWELDRLE
ncbi:hypothetical protein AB0O91_00755 [Kitasatospora sp. NPDC089797]|uniref:hypothetical protein n=1 Tax=Kitasatospora sp. NPDC089797 TaxID=3155298 RepID=UPI003426C19C